VINLDNVNYDELGKMATVFNDLANYARTKRNGFGGMRASS
jgi:hypothetical protein